MTSPYRQGRSCGAQESLIWMDEMMTSKSQILRDDEPCFVISIAAEMVRMHPQTLRRYDEIGLVRPTRLSGKRFYSPRDIDRLRKICRMTEDLGLNLAGVEIVLRLTDQLEELRNEMELMRSELEAEISRLRRTTSG